MRPPSGCIGELVVGHIIKVMTAGGQREMDRGCRSLRWRSARLSLCVQRSRRASTAGAPPLSYFDILTFWHLRARLRRISLLMSLLRRIGFITASTTDRNLTVGWAVFIVLIRGLVFSPGWVWPTDGPLEPAPAARARAREERGAKCCAS